MGVGPAVVVVTGVVMLAWSWGTWPDVIVDFGRELYVAWRLADGQRLYADLAYFNGPLSPYVNGLWFRLFGASLRTLVAANIVVLGLVTALFYRIVHEIAGRLAAATACVTFLVLFACVQLVRTGNYNFICPYSHEMTHGLLLALVAVRLLSAVPRRGMPAAAGGGLALGLAFLTKPEMFVAAASAGVVAVVTSLRFVRRPRATIATLFGAMILPPLAAVALLGLGMPSTQAIAGVLGGWPWILRGELASTPFYRLGMGTLDPLASVVTMLEATVLYAITLGPLAFLALRGSLRPVVKAAGLAIVIGFAIAVWQLGPVRWYEAARPLPLAVAALAIDAGVRLMRGRDPALVLELSMAVLSAALLAKIVLAARIHHYGFALGAPGTVLVVAALLGRVPSAIARRGGDARVFRAGVLVLLGLGLAVYLPVAGHWIAQKRVVVGRGADAFLADERGTVVNQALADIATRIAPAGTLAVFPEGVMLDYLARRTTPLRNLNFMPVELLMFGEDAMAGELASHPPDFVALVHKDSAEYGARFFGHDYGRDLAAWITGHYRVVAQHGALPFHDERFGILLLARHTD
jgi:Dolichyl-phosphate-mannose-protein mannosyltransferase